MLQKTAALTENHSTGKKKKKRNTFTTYQQLKAPKTKTTNATAVFIGGTYVNTEDVHYTVISYRVKQGDDTPRDNRQRMEILETSDVLKCKQSSAKLSNYTYKNPITHSSQNCPAVHKH